MILAAAAALAGPTPGRLMSRMGFSVARPAGWRGSPRSDGAIEMLSPGPGAEGVVIARGQADIMVSAVDLPAGRRLVDAIAIDVDNDRVLGRSTLAAPPAPDHCVSLLAVDTLDEVGPHTDQRLTLLYCRVGARAWRIVLRSWEADPDHLKRRWRAAAIAVARSLRIAIT